MNTFYQLNSSTLFLQGTVLILKITANEDIIDLIPAIGTIFVGLVILKLYVSHQQKLKKHLVTLLLLDMIFINLFQKRSTIVSYVKYINIGRFLHKYTKNEQIQTYSHLIMVAFAFIIEVLIYEFETLYDIAILSWYIIFFILPPLFFKQKNIQIHENQIPLPLSVDNTQRRDINHFESVTQRLLLGQSSEFPLEFYQQILERHYDGILILNQRKEAVLISDSLRKILNVKDKNNIVTSVLNLKNCHNEIKEQERMNIMFQALASKLNSSDFDADEHQEELVEQQKAFSQSESVYQELERVFKQVIEGQQLQDEKGKEQKKKIKFLFENYMICQQDSVLARGFDRQQTIQSSYRGPQLYEVTQRPFVFQQVIYILITVKDVTHFNQIRVLKAINENKSQMLAQVAHEFRTPLNCISLLIDNLAELLNQSLIDEYLKPIQISAKTLLSFVNDLLDIAQLKAGKFKLVHIKMDLRDLLHEIQQFLKPQIEAKGNQLSLTIIPDQELPIYSDPNRIRQIIFNLVSNANKFTQTGMISISLVRINLEMYEITVKDTGVGIDPQDQEKLFKAFSKLDRNKELNAQGVGLGLMISNILAERLAISCNIDNTSVQQNEAQGLSVYSEGKNKGTSFTFHVYDQYEFISQQGKESKYAIKVPDVESEYVQQTIKRTKTKLDRQFADDALKSDIYIMIVDDEPFNITALSKSLKRKFNVEGFFSGAEALSRVKQPLPLHTIILQDIEMPIMDGFTISKQIKQLVGDSVYIIGCSGHGESIKQQCLEAGMDNFLQKPVKLDQLMKIIDKLF